MTDLGLNRLNQMSLPDVLKALGRCCGSSTWCFKMASGRPYPSRSELFHFAELKFRSLTRKEWLEAFAHHPPIADALSTLESLSALERKELEDSCRRYSRRFGHVFIIRMGELTPAEILFQLKRRLRQVDHDEFFAAGYQQSLITMDKLNSLLDELSYAEPQPLHETTVTDLVSMRPVRRITTRQVGEAQESARSDANERSIESPGQASGQSA